MYKQVMIAVDGSEHSLRATKKAIALVKNDYEAKISLVYAIDSSSSKTDVINNVDKYQVQNKRREKLEKIENLLKEEMVEYELHFLHGEPTEVIVAFANEHSFDCVVVGSRGLNRLQGMVLGSVSHKIAKRVDAPVMIVK